MKNEKAVSLILEDGHVFHGFSFGFEKPVCGEVVFSTAMTGYVESLTDPSYSGQILAITFPLVGNYGVPKASFDAEGLSSYYESEKIHVRALVIGDYSYEYSHWNASMSLSEWLKSQQVVGIYGIDTRELTKVLREQGTMKAKIIFDHESEIDFEDNQDINFVASVSCEKPVKYGHGDKKVCLVDCGLTHSLVRTLVSYGVEIIRVPWDYDFTADGVSYDGLFISPGPGNPNLCHETIAHIKKFMESGKPICGVGLGHQLLALAAGAKVSKLKVGHRGHNQPVRLVGTNKCVITAQNHSYAVVDDSLPSGWKSLFVSMNDDSNEGIRHDQNPWSSTQFIPETAEGSVDTHFVFKDFFDAL